MKREITLKIQRSPRYPFVDLDKAITRASELWAAVGPSEAGVTGASKAWGYGEKSSGAVQTEAALKQFGLIDVLGRGELRRLKLSKAGQRIVGDSKIDPAERRDLIEKAALSPNIHRELWGRWQSSLPHEEVRAYLIQRRGFQEKGADAVIAEYQKTMSFLHSVTSDRFGAVHPHLPNIVSGHAVPNSDPRSPSLLQATAENFVDLRFEGDRLILSARIDRDGIPDLIRILRANQISVGRKQKMPRVKNTPSSRTKRRN
jgi:hypothetical protein